MHRAFGRYADKSLITAFLCRSDALSLIPVIFADAVSTWPLSSVQRNYSSRSPPEESDERVRRDGLMQVGAEDFSAVIGAHEQIDDIAQDRGPGPPEQCRWTGLLSLMFTRKALSRCLFDRAGWRF
jgi:hypothetical protein